MNLKQQIYQLKKDWNAIILVHNYQSPEIQSIADILGDSLELAKKATQVAEKTIVFCGVRFMAETAKILSPDKTILLPRFDAGCPMADMITANQLRKLKAQYPKAKAVTYINSAADVKAESDVCCTSANALKVVQNIDADEIIFSPDQHLADYCQRFTKKRIIPWKGFCIVHHQITPQAIIAVKEKHSKAKVLVHPECPSDVIDIADEVLSTSGMVKIVKESDDTEFIIVTEEGLIHRLQQENPTKAFYGLAEPMLCRNMKKTSLQDVFNALDKMQYRIELPDSIINRSQHSLQEMLRYV